MDKWIYENDFEISLTDFFLEIIKKWPALLASMLVGALLLGAYGGFASSNAGEITLEEKIEASRSSLTEGKAAEIEGLYKQYQEYISLRRLLQDQYAEFMTDLETVGSSYVKVSKYLCESKEVSPLRLLDGVTLGENEYKKIAEICGEKDYLKNGGRNRVFFGIDSNDKTAVNDEEILPVTYILGIRVIGDSPEQCDEIQKVVDEKINTILSSYTSAGGEMTIKRFATEYDNNIMNVIDSTMVSQSTQLKNLSDAIANLQNNTIDKMAVEEKEYFNLLKEQGFANDANEEEETGTAGPSIKSFLNKKFILLGAFAGLFAACFVLLLKYVFNKTVKTEDEIVTQYHIPLLYSLMLKADHPSSLVRKLYSKITHRKIDFDNKADLIASDLLIQLKKQGADSLYLLVPSQNEKLLAETGKIAEKMNASDPQIHVYYGDPAKDAQQMERLAGADRALQVFMLKDTERDELKNQLLMCRRYEVPVMGVISVAEI